MTPIKLRRKYRVGRTYINMPHSATPNGGDAFLNKSAHHVKLNATQKAKLPPQPFRVMVLRNGKCRMRDG
jgi:hypothetical protein